MHLVPAFLLILSLALPAQAENFEDWFQVDVILFKPVTTSLDDESWPEKKPAYPADVISVYEPGPFNLSVLDQLAVETEISMPETPRLASDEFAFQGQSRGNYNRRVIRAVTGEEEDEPAIADDDSDDSEIAAAPQVFDPESIVIEQRDSAGRLAFTSTLDDSSLETVLRSLNRSSRFRVLSHDSWIQPLSLEPTPVMVQAGDRYDDLFEVEGTLSFSVSRFLHLQTDLWYTVFEPRGIRRTGPPPATFENLSEETLAAYADLVEVERQRGQYFPARQHNMAQSRRIRSGELHYIDHPLFGVIVQISRYNGPAEP